MKLLLGLVAVVAVYVPLALWQDAGVAPTTPWVILLAGAAFAGLALTMTRATRGWSVRAVGLLLMLTGAAVLLLVGGIGYYWYMGATVSEAASDLVLACWLVGSVLSLTGTVMYWLSPDDSDEIGG